MKIALYSMVPGLAEKSPQEVLDLCCEAGIDGIEWIHWRAAGRHLDPDDMVGSAERLGEMARAAGLAVVDFTAEPEADDLDSVKAHLEIAAAMGAPAMRMRSRSAARQAGKTLQEQSDHVRRVLANMAPLCEQYGVRVQYETVWGSVMASASMARRICEGLDPAWFGILIDPANMMVEGFEGWRVCCEVLGPYLHNVHCKNVWFEPSWPRQKGQVRWRFVFRPLRLGLVDWAEVVEALKEHAYDGWLCIEDCDNTYGAEERIRDDARFLRALLS